MKYKNFNDNHDYKLSFQEMDAGVLTVSCGNVTATLHKQLFRCPGIHSRCIEKDGEWITPKELCIIGDKARLKDWKTAIRHEKMSLRYSISNFAK